MSGLRAFAALYRSHLLQWMRVRTAFFWTLMFPMLFLLVFGFVFGRGDPEDTRLVMPGLLTITLISGSFFGVAFRMVSERELGILRRHRVAPVGAAPVVLAHGALALTTLLIALALQLVVARLLFHFRPQGSLAALGAMLFVGAVALVPLGLIVGSVARDARTAPVITNLLFFPMMFLSGAAFPFWLLPGWMQRLGRLLPTTYVNEALHGIVVRGHSVAAEAAPVAVLLATGALGLALNAALFRWESEEPVRAGRVALAVAVLSAVYGGAYWFIPSLEMVRRGAP